MDDAKLFSSILKVKLKKRDEKVQAFVESSFPPDSQAPFKIEDFCFPDAAYWTPLSDYHSFYETYSLVLTDPNGERLFGYCRRIVPEGHCLTMPIAYCILSKHRAHKLYSKILEEIERIYGSDRLSRFLESLYKLSFPKSNQTIIGVEEITICRPLDGDYRTFSNQRYLFRSLGYDIDTTLKLFVSVLFERKVVLQSRSITKLSRCLDGLESLMSPFKWQHTLIPVLPSSLIHILGAPTPYLIGIHDTSKGLFIEDEVIVVNLDCMDDSSPVIMQVGDELDLLPDSLTRVLRDRLVTVTLFDDDDEEAIQNIIISEAFINFFLSTVGDYRQFVEKETFFNFEKMVNESEVKEFLRNFGQTSCFRDYIDSKLKESSTMDDYETRIRERLNNRRRKIPISLQKFKTSISSTTTTTTRPESKILYVDGESTMSNILRLVRKKFDLRPEEAIFLFVGCNLQILPLHATLADIYRSFGVVGQVLNIYYCTENTFG